LAGYGATEGGVLIDLSAMQAIHIDPDAQVACVEAGTTAGRLTTAVLETFLGLTLLSGSGLRVGLVVMAVWLGGIMAPVVLFPGEMFPGGFPTLTAQYVLKDIILAGAWAVVAAHVLGARLIPANLDDAVIRRTASGQPAGQPNPRGDRRAGDEHDQERRPHH
jgi:hypothetical protein